MKQEVTEENEKIKVITYTSIFIGFSLPWKLTHFKV